MTNIALGLFHEPQAALAAAGTLKGAGFADLEGTVEGDEIG